MSEKDDSENEDDELLGAIDATLTRGTVRSGGGDKSAIQASETPKPNPFHSLRDISKSGIAEDDDLDGNFALFQGELRRRPKVAQVLGNLVRYNAVPGRDQALWL